MNAEEFREWFAYHCGLHPDFREWFAEQPESGRTALRQAFENAMRRTDLEKAKDASMGLVDGRYTPPKDWAFGKALNETARTVAQLAAVERSAIDVASDRAAAAKERTYKCPHCMDKGLAYVFSPVSVEKLLKEPARLELLETIRGVDLKPARIPIDGDARDPQSFRRLLDEVLAGAKVVDWGEHSEAVAAARKLTTSSVVCHCEAGHALFEAQGVEVSSDDRDPARKWRKGQRYNERRHCLCPGGDTVRNVPYLLEWIEWRREEARHAQAERDEEQESQGGLPF